MSSLQKLADLLGFLPSYINSFNEQVNNSEQAVKALVKALGHESESESLIQADIEQLTNKGWLQMLPSSIVLVQGGNSTHTIEFSLPLASGDLTWSMDLENGQQLEGTVNLSELEQLDSCQINQQQFIRYSLAVPEIALGYHELTLNCSDHSCKSQLIVVPSKCYSPAQASDKKVWGFAAQLYSLSSDNTWGIGDYGCLYELIKQASERGVSAIGLNPLHPLYPSNPAHRSPYSPTSRCFLNTIYIDILAVPGYKQSGIEQSWLSSTEFELLLKEVRGSELIDYQTAGYMKYKALREIFDKLSTQYLDKTNEWGESFASFIDSKGQELISLATYDALYERFKNQGLYGWNTWPKEYHDPYGKTVADFQQQNQLDIYYYAWLQWLADQQLCKVRDFAKQQGMAIGLYLDLAVGCDGGGAEVWANQSAFLAGAAVGAPPDAMNVLGQNWGLTPINPEVLRRQGYQPLVKALRCSMKYAGAIRIDHILGFMRQYWVAPGMKADQGVYIRFPLQEMLGIIALESQRNQCVVIGEDLGTVPGGFSEIMEAAGLLSYKVLFFERWEDGLFKRPDAYPEQSMATVSTHDLHTLAGWWSDNDLKWRRDLNLYPNQAMADSDEQARPKDKHNLFAALIDYGLLPKQEYQTDGSKLPHDVAIAVQQFLARSNSAIQLIPMEDALQLEEQVNIPGTIDEHPNWMRKLPCSIDEFWSSSKVLNLVAAMQSERPNN